MNGLVAEGRLDHCKPGPVIWVDCADSQPCIGTAGAITWHLTANGHRFHSGLPHKGINAIEMGMEAASRIQQKFYESFPACEGAGIQVHYALNYEADSSKVCPWRIKSDSS